MYAITRRAFSRNTYRAPIHFSDQHVMESPQEFHEGEMINSSIGGMAFLSGRALAAGSGILIKMVDLVPDPYWLEARQDYLAEVRWCVKKENEETHLYQVGVRFLVDTCRMCDKTILRGSTDAADLCPDCLTRVCSLCDGSVRECIEKYLMGNVL